MQVLMHAQFKRLRPGANLSTRYGARFINRCAFMQPVKIRAGFDNPRIPW